MKVIAPGRGHEPRSSPAQPLYFTVTTFSTAGFGDITPVSETASLLQKRTAKTAPPSPSPSPASA